MKNILLKPIFTKIPQYVTNLLKFITRSWDERVEVAAGPVTAAAIITSGFRNAV
jgi:hypothetical protein